MENVRRRTVDVARDGLRQDLEGSLRAALDGRPEETTGSEPGPPRRRDDRAVTSETIGDVDASREVALLDANLCEDLAARSGLKWTWA